MLEEGFELELEAGLAQDGVFVAFGEAFEEDALVGRWSLRRAGLNSLRRRRRARAKASRRSCLW